MYMWRSCATHGHLTNLMLRVTLPYSLNFKRVNKTLLFRLPYHSCKEPYVGQLSFFLVKDRYFQLNVRVEWSSFQFHSERATQIDFPSQKSETNTTRTRGWNFHSYTFMRVALWLVFKTVSEFGGCVVHSILRFLERFVETLCT